MESNFVSYDRALALKELDFDEPCLDYYYKVYKEDTIELWRFSKTQWPDTSHPIVWAPLKQQVFKFFREKYELYYTIRPVRGSKKYGFVFSIYSENDDINETYEEAENACIDKLIEIAIETAKNLKETGSKI
jgi:hypothetical protein